MWKFVPQELQTSSVVFTACHFVADSLQRKQNFTPKYFNFEIIRNSLMSSYYFMLTFLYLATVPKYNQPAVSYYKPVP